MIQSSINNGEIWILCGCSCKREELMRRQEKQWGNHGCWRKNLGLMCLQGGECGVDMAARVWVGLRWLEVEE